MRSSRIEDILLDLVLDAYDDVRNLATSLLYALQPRTTNYTQSIDGSEAPSSRPDVLRHVEALVADTGRASHGDGLGRLYELQFAGVAPFAKAQTTQYAQLDGLLQLLESDICRAEKFLAAAVATSPIPAHLVALRYEQSPAFVRAIEESFQVPYQPFRSGQRILSRR